MPSRCIVPGCKGNYDSGPRVKVYSFPGNIDMRNKWIAAIPRENLTVTKSSKVCENHFLESDIERFASAYDERTGKLITAQLMRTRLKKDAVPKLFPGCPAYLSSDEPSREAPDAKRFRLENDQLQQCINKSLREQAQMEQLYVFYTYTELLEKLKEHTMSPFWTVSVKDSETMFVAIIIKQYPQLAASIVVREDLSISVYVGNTTLTQCGSSDKIPTKITDLRKLLDILNYVETVVTCPNEKNDITLIQDLLNNLQVIDENAKQFISEQLNLLVCHKNQRRYSTHTMIFFCILYTISPHAYRFLRQSHVIAPLPKTIRKICAKLDMDPRCEQSADTFLKYAEEIFFKKIIALGRMTNQRRKSH